MPKDSTYVRKNHAIRACLTEHPSTPPKRIVEILAARGIHVSPSQVIVVQAVVKSERTEQLAAVP